MAGDRFNRGSAARGDVNHPTSIAATVALGVIGALGVFSFLPLVVGAAVDDLGLSERAAGLLAAAEMGGSGLATLLMSFGIQRWNRRRIATTGLGVIMAGSLLSLNLLEPAMLIAARGLTGLGEGGWWRRLSPQCPGRGRLSACSACGLFSTWRRQVFCSFS